MREIKFRAWDGIRMTTSGIMFNTSNGCLEVPKSLSFNPTAKDIDTYKLMQYTGLKDKNGKEIYEGDNLYSNGYFCTVIFANGCFKSVYNHPEDGEVLTLEELGTHNYVVIGNIYENPELL